ncbi:MAG: ATP-dependent DNA helicase [Actinomycetia bacterium]|nr:ATP-dependent DNA helicase [Actinomycetes bacterium]
MPDLDDLLHAAVADLGGSERPGQTEMAKAVERAIETGEHLLVQAGTGTGKSLAYLVPAIAHAMETGQPVIVATATIALQGQIVDRDLPRLASALTPLLGRRPTFAIVKGRRNYVCKNKLAGGFPDEEEMLFGTDRIDSSLSAREAEAKRVRDWAEETETGDRDDLVPGVSDRVWKAHSVSADECLGQRCPLVNECFVELARAAAQDVDVVVTNHSFMAIDSFEGRFMLPEHDTLIIDEGHELVDRVTSTITDELWPGAVRGGVRRASRFLDSAERLEDAGEALGDALDAMPEGRLATGIPDAVAMALAQVRDAARAAFSEVKPEDAKEIDGARQVALASLDELFDVAERILEERELDVVWVAEDQWRGKVLNVAPMSVAMLLREHIFADRSVIVTSATLELGGSFDTVAGTMGLRGEGTPAWQGLDVGSPFDYAKQAIAYVATHLPPPGRDGLQDAFLDEIELLVRAAGGRTLGLFSSMRAAKQAAEVMRARFENDPRGITFLCQGEDQMTTLVRAFAREPAVCLFGTLTLWQGVDVPGSACQLVIIDRVPFPRPDDPITAARSQVIAQRGGNGFMSVSAPHAALRLAQGAGRLIRRADDRGIVAFLDNRMMTARYAGFLQRSLPPFYPTTDQALVVGALRRLDEGAPEPLPVHEPPPRTLSGRSAMPTAAVTTPNGSPSGTSGSDSSGPTAPAPPPPAGSRTAVTVGEAWSEQDDEELREGVDLGIDIEAIADQLEKSVQAVESRIAALGLNVSDDQEAFSFE